MIDPTEIKRLAIAHGFTERQQPDGSMDLNPYVYEFARACYAAGQKDAASPSVEQAQYIEVQAEARYWEDAIVDDEPDWDGTLIPCRNGDSWAPVIRLEDGQIIDWPAGKEANIYYKVCDAGEYWLLDADRTRIAQWRDDYVPDDILCVGAQGYGDYIIFKVGADGKIKNWRFPGLNAEQWEVTPNV